MVRYVDRDGVPQQALQRTAQEWDGDGSTVEFELSHTPAGNEHLLLYRNGLLQRLGTDYTRDGATVTFTAGNTPDSGDWVHANYWY